MRKLQALKIALLIVILAEEIKRAKESKKVLVERDGFKQNYVDLVTKELSKQYDIR
ncbi:hypothetical protein KYI07_07725 [Macrococcus psychrotolerans]|uniref:Uncharacterized protein n=1 Tax=Macrococcus psychrotolerans TaxID=3039389 RepID=A0AAT9P3T5_9STAP|nr:MULTISPECIES: hypothetical protein [Macrococcus]QYA32274.1 hypothetical protein KYI10_07735 [Macrococcus sp. 19Msa1099]QYA37080.1 hypothetical protein KYI07_07725 [Macrococcus caseolyticus]QYA75788.1 hypothetical protein KYI12_07725 [Macrococcus caseolyticus]